jgi:uridine kinase
MYWSGLGFRFTLLIADIFLLLILLQQFGSYAKQILTFYWLSPLLLYIVYWHGQIDLIPVVLLFFSLGCLKNGEYKLGGVVLALSVTSKYSMLIGVPIIFVYLWLNTDLKGGFWETLTSFSILSILLIGPFLLSSGFWDMVIFNSEIDRLYALTMDLGNRNIMQNTAIYIIPSLYLLFLYYAWRMQRMNYELLLATLAVGFSIIIFLTPPPPGWLLWLVPLYALHQSKSSGGAVYLISAFSLLFISYHLIISSGAAIAGYEDSIISSNVLERLITILKGNSIFNTLIFSFGSLIGVQIYREGIQGNDYFHLGMRPLVIGVSGDSSTGKSTFSNALIELFGSSGTYHLEGDDYHNWDRQSPMWNSITHLNPRANGLYDLVHDLRMLLDGNSINTRSYDHSKGYFSPLLLKKSKKLILISGLHTLYLKTLVDEIDKSFYMTMDEPLRTHIKIQRDINRGRDRQYTLSEIEKRVNDSEKYIHPQADRADVLFNILPVNPDDINDKTTPEDIKLKLKVTIKNCSYYNELMRALTGVCNLNVNLDDIDESGGVKIEIQGDIDSDDILIAMNMLAPRIDELINTKKGFSNGILGVMELIALLEINDQLSVNRRRRNA